MRWRVVGPSRSLEIAAALLLLAGCGPSDQSPLVEYSGTGQMHFGALGTSPGAQATPAGPAPTEQPDAAGTAAMQPIAGAETAMPGAPAAGAGATAGAGGMGAQAGAGAATEVAGTEASGAGGSSGGAGGAGGAGADEMPVGPKPTKVTFEYTTKTQDGRYAPDNVGAVWVEDASGKWIHTLEFWGNVPNGSHLSRYNRAGGPDYGSFFGIRSVTPPPDTITSATLHMHKSHTGLSWNLKDKAGAEIPDGSYKLVIELTEEEAAGEFLEIPFTKGPQPAEIPTPDSPYYTGMNLALQ